MKSRWEPKTIEVEFHASTFEKENERIAELAKILYSAFSQLESIDSVRIQDQTFSTASPFPRTETASDGIRPSAA